MSSFFAKAQDAGFVKWTLQECVSYALANNIQVKETELDNQSSKINYAQQKYNRYNR